MMQSKLPSQHTSVNGGLQLNPSDISGGQQTDGTTLIACKYNGGIICAADGRSSNQTFVGDRVADKLEPVHERIYVQRAGTSAHTRTVTGYLRYYIDVQALELQAMPPVVSAAACLQNIIYGNPGLQAHMICSGWDPYKGYQIFDVNMVGFRQEKDIAVGGSGGTFVQGFVDANYRTDFTLEEAQEFITKAITYAAFRDSSSGGCIRMVNITKEKVTRSFIPYTDFKKK